MNLRELTQEQKEILAIVEDGDLSLDEVSDHLEMLNDDIKRKVENSLFIINNLEQRELVLSSEIERIQELKKSTSSNKEKLKDWLLINLDDGQKHEFDLFKVSKVKGRQIVNVVDQEKLPARFIRVNETISVDKVQMLKDMKAGINVDGAEIAIGKPSLRIK